MPIEDYYALIGVSPDADRDEIREAYKERRAELSDDDSGRANAARLNRAWNVLSDTAQRHRYDDQLAAAKADDDVVVPDAIESTNGSAKGMTRGQARRERYRQQSASRNGGRNARQPVVMETELNGVPLATNRDRVTALVIDGMIAFLLLFILAGFVTQSAEKHFHPAIVKARDAKNDELTATQKQIDAAIKSRDAAKNTADKNRFNAQKTAAEKHYDNVTKQINTLQGKLRGTDFMVLFGAGVITLLIFAVPTSITGQSPGKALRKIKLVKDDAVTPAGAKTAFIHYGAVIGFIVASSALGQLAQIAWIVAVFGVSSFTRNPKRQGWDNRISKTVVVQA